MAQPAMCATPNLPIPDGAPGFARDGLALADVGAVQDLAVQVVVDHAFIGDLTATLSHLDSAETITLFERPGKTSELKNDFGCSGDDIYAVLRDGEPFNTDNSCNDDPGAGLDGAFEADDALSTFNGTAIAGDWEIALNDAFTPDAGVLQHWCLLGAVFDTDRFALTVDVVGQGKVQAPEVTFFCPDDCSEPLPAGTMVALTPIAAPGYSFSGFSGDCSGLSCTVNMNASRAVTATFVQDADVLFRDGFESW